jgi:YD repeat-containing protein
MILTFKLEMEKKEKKRGGVHVQQHECKNGRVKRRSACAPLFVTLVCTLFLVAPALAGSITYTYDDAGRLVTADYGNGSAIEYTYDNAGNLLARTITSANPANILTANFTASNTCFCTNITFNDTSLPGDADITEWRWELGDSTILYTQNVSWHYDNYGSYQVNLTVTDTLGCNNTISKWVTVYANPVADFTASSPCFCTNVTFTDESTDADGTIVGWFWDFGDGVGTSDVQYPEWHYASPGIYQVNLTVWDNQSCSNTTSRLVQVYANPVANFTAPSVCNGTPTQFTDLSQKGSGNIDNWTWNFGDGFYNFTQHPAHTYAGPGVYLLTLTVKDTNGCENTTIKNVTVSSNPDANFTFINACFCRNVSFTNTTVNGTPPYNFSWDFDNDGVYELVGTAYANPTWHYNASGPHTARLYVEDDVGCSDEITKNVTVWENPIANFTFTRVCFCTDTQFNDTSTGGTGSYSYKWDFGDGNTSTARDPIYHFATPGNKTVTLNITDANNCTNETTKEVQVYSNPVVNFTATTPCLCGDTQFNPSVSGGTPSYSYLWDFDNNGVWDSSLSNPTYHFNISGTHPVKLNVTDANGCTNETTKNVTVYANPTVDFVVTDVCYCTGTYFVDISVAGDGEIVSWFWDFGDGVGTSDAQYPEWHYASPGIYQVNLTVWDNQSCSNTTSRLVRVYANPVADFEATKVKIGEDTEFTSTVTGGTPPYNYSWDFDSDGTYELEGDYPTPSWHYPFAGIFNVTLTVVDDFGCSDTSTGTVEVYIVPHTDVGVAVAIELVNSTEIVPYVPPGTDLSNAVVIKVNVTDNTPENATDDAYTDLTIEVGALNIATCTVFKEGSGFLLEVDDVTTLPTVKPPGVAKFARDLANNSVIVRLYVGDPLLAVVPPSAENVFDTGNGTYPSICGNHTGTIMLNQTITISKLYTYPCPGTGGHTEYVKIWNSTAGWNVTATWNGYKGDWHTIAFNNSCTLYANETYNYTIRTGSYPQIIHSQSCNATGGVITCTEFVDINGKQHEGWIPAIRLF